MKSLSKSYSASCVNTSTLWEYRSNMVQLMKRRGIELKWRVSIEHELDELIKCVCALPSTICMWVDCISESAHDRQNDMLIQHNFQQMDSHTHTTIHSIEPHQTHQFAPFSLNNPTISLGRRQLRLCSRVGKKNLDIYGQDRGLTLLHEVQHMQSATGLGHRSIDVRENFPYPVQFDDWVEDWCYSPTWCAKFPFIAKLR